MSEKPTEQEVQVVEVEQVDVGTELAVMDMSYRYAFEYKLDIQNRIVQLSTITPGSFERLDTAMSMMETSSNEPITIKIHSVGGDVYEALAIVGRITSSPCVIYTIGYGAIMSAATLILACGDQRFMSKYATFMHHESSYSTGFDRHSTIKGMVNQQEKDEEAWAKYMAEFTKKNAKYWKTKGLTDFYLTPEQCISHGIIDSII